MWKIEETGCSCNICFSKAKMSTKRKKIKKKKKENREVTGTGFSKRKKNRNVNKRPILFFLFYSFLSNFFSVYHYMTH